MSRKISFSGQTFVVPDDATDDEITQIAGPSTPSTPLPNAGLAPAAGAPPKNIQPQPLSGTLLSAGTDAANSLDSTTRDLGIGAVKQAGSLPSTISGWINKIPGVGEDLAPKAGVDAFKAAVTPTNTAQKIGGGLEQAGEMALTGGPLKSGAELLATKFPFLTRATPAVLRTLAEAINTGGNAALHGEKPGIPAALGGGSAALGEVASAAAPAVKNLAESQYSKFLNPTKETTKNMTENVVPGLLERRVVAPTTIGNFADKAAAKADEVGADIGSAVSNIPATVRPQTQPILNSLEKYKQSFIVNGVPIDAAGVKNAEDLQETVKALGPNLSYQSLNKARQILDSGVARAGGYAGKTLAEGSTIDARREAANALRSELSKASPEVAKLNAEFHFWTQVRDVADATASRKTGQQGMLKYIASAAGLAGGLAHGGTAEGMAGAIIMPAIEGAIRSPAWRTASAVFKNELARQMANGNAAAVLKMTGRLGAAGEGQ